MEQLEEETEAKRAVERQVSSLNMQVNYTDLLELKTSVSCIKKKTTDKKA